MNQKKGRIYGKLLLDLVLLVLLALMYRKRAISIHFHETGGLVLCGLFLVHKALNWQWIRVVTAGMIRKKAKLSARWIVDVLLLLSMTAVLITGLLISKTLPTALANSHGLQVWHYFFAATALVLSGIHLGLHGTHLKNNLWSKLPLPEKAGKAAGILLLCIVFCFGSYSLVTSGLVSNFSRPFASVGASRDIGYASSAEMSSENREAEHARNGQGYGKGMGAGKRQGMGKNRSEQGGQPVSSVDAFSTLITYASILGWFAIVTSLLENWLRKRKKGTAVNPRMPQE